MAVGSENTAPVTPKKSTTERRDWLRTQREAVRARGNMSIQWDPITIKGEPLSVTIIRERRGDFDDDLLS